MADLYDERVTELIVKLKAGDSEGALKIFALYFNKLVRLARSKLGGAARRVADEEDVAASVFKSLCMGAAKGKFTILADREDLWRLLLTITHQKTVDHLRSVGRQKRGNGKVRGNSVFARSDENRVAAGFDQFLSDEPTPAFLAEANEQFQRLLARLRDDTLRNIAVWKMEGLTNEEIAKRLEITERSVERKLKLIREKWSTELCS